MRRALITAAAAVVASLAFGQELQMGPSPEMKKFDWLVGEWTSTSKWTMEQMPATDVTVNAKVEWDGQFLRQTSVYDYGVFKMTETMMMGYDAQKKRYFSHAYTNVSPMPRVEYGTLDGNTMTLVSEPWGDGTEADATIGRVTMTKVSNDEMKFKLEFKTGDKWATVTEGVYKRKK